ncbi:hypothetical protein H2199_001969 [Coniosporium tulheliwenetii]|uniref:Uncharacterized protein n=1 Tax=Coniosporium tulheliwenetii TaxID=3383036 RepID=A0ACC2ZH48_9PEZI|nr:hypothetical protein H2199_001969 [Cladosporium sp. JES 115]
MAEYEQKSEKFAEEFETLWNILTATAMDSSPGNIVCIVDALDECEPDSRRQLIKSLVKFYSRNTTQKKGLKILVTGRPYPAIERDFEALPTIRLKAELELEAIDRDIELVIQSRIRRLGEHRTFLWVSLILSLIEESDRASKSALQDLIDTIPDTLDAVYEKILSKAASQASSRNYAMKILHVVVGATRPLSLEEMKIVLAIDSRHQSESDLEDDMEPCVSDTIRGLCGLFVRVIDERVYLIHQTAREFLVSSSQSQYQVGKWKHSLSPYDSNRLLTEACLWYLMLSDFKSSPLILSGGRRGYDLKATVNNLISQHKFLDYAANHWASHFRVVQQEDKLLGLALKNCRTQTKGFRTWFGIYWTTAHEWDAIPDWTELHVGAYFGHEVVVKLLLARDDVDANLKDSYGRTPLSRAAAGGHEAVVKLLLARDDVDANSKDKEGRTPLLLAAWKGQEAVVKLLLARDDVDANSKDSYGRTPLSRAAWNRHEAVVKLRLARDDVDANPKDSYGQTPLWWAAQDGHEAVVKLLLARDDVDANSKNEDDQTPLSRAAENGHEAVVKLLLARDDVEKLREPIWAPLLGIYRRLDYRQGCQASEILKAARGLGSKRGECASKSGGQTPPFRDAFSLTSIYLPVIL